MKRALALLLVLGLSGLARAQEEDEKPADAETAVTRDDPCVNLASQRGLTGMREMLDARTPGGDWHIRAGAYLQGSSTAIGTSGQIRTMTRDRYEFTPYVGASFLGHIDVGFHWAFPQVEHTLNRLHDLSAPVPDPWPRVHQSETFGGGGNFSFAAKASWTFGPVSLAAYGLGQTNTGSRLMTHKEDSFGELGGAGTLSLADGRVAIHLNLGGQNLETRHLGWRFRYRTGFSFVVADTESFAVRTFIYGDGLEAEGSSGSDYRLGAGVQFQLSDRCQLEVTGDGRLVANQLSDPFEDEGTYSVAFAAGFLY